jgi:hypothetical protein
VDELEESVRRCVRAAYEAWVGPPGPLRGPSGWGEDLPPALRPIRFISWEELDRYAEITADIDAQVRRELARTPTAQRTSRRSPRLRRSATRRVA